MGQRPHPSSTITFSSHNPKPSQRGSPSSKAWSQRRTGQSARHGGGSQWSCTPHRPCRGGGLRRYSRANPGIGEELREPRCSKQCFTSLLSLFLFCWGLVLPHHGEMRCDGPTLPPSSMSAGFLTLEESTVKAKPPVQQQGGAHAGVPPSSPPCRRQCMVELVALLEALQRGVITGVCWVWRLPPDASLLLNSAHPSPTSSRCPAVWTH